MSRVRRRERARPELEDDGRESVGSRCALQVADPGPDVRRPARRAEAGVEDERRRRKRRRAGSCGRSRAMAVADERRERRRELVQEADVLVRERRVVAVAHELDAAPAAAMVPACGHELVAHAVRREALAPARAAGEVAGGGRAERDARALAENEAGLARHVAALLELCDLRQLGPEVELCDPAHGECALGIGQRPAPALESDRRTEHGHGLSLGVLRRKPGACERLEPLANTAAGTRGHVSQRKCIVLR